MKKGNNNSKKRNKDNLKLPLSLFSISEYLEKVREMSRKGFDKVGWINTTASPSPYSPCAYPKQRCNNPSPIIHPGSRGVGKSTLEPQVANIARVYIPYYYMLYARHLRVYLLIHNCDRVNQSHGFLQQYTQSTYQ